MNLQNKSYIANAKWPAAVRESLEFAWQENIQRFNEVLDQVGFTLLENAKAADGYKEKDRFVTAMENCSAKRPEAVAAFLEKWESICQDLDEEKTAQMQALAVKTDLSHLRVLDEATLQGKIELQFLVSTTTQNLLHLLTPTLNGFEQALPKRNVSSSTLALFPVSLSECIFEALESLDVAADIRAILLNDFKNQYFSNLEPVFEHIISIFRQQGYKLKTASLTRSTSVPPRARAWPPTYPGYPPEMHATAPTLEADVSRLLLAGALPTHLPAIREEASGGYYGTATALSAVPTNLDPSTSIITVSRQEVDALLAGIQASTLDDEIPDIQKTLAHSLKASASTNTYKVMNQTGESVINLVSLMFDMILQNKSIPLLVSTLLMRLQIPYMRLAITDQTLFSQRDHSARLSLNMLSEIGAGANDTESAAYKYIVGVVTELTDNYEGGTAQFERIAKNLAAFLAKGEEKIATAEIETEKNEATEESLALAAEVAAREVEQRIEPIEQPLVFHALLLKVWTELLRDIHVKHGEDSDEWQAGITTLDNIIWSTLVVSDKNGKAKLLKMLPGLVSTLTSLFDVYGMDKLLEDHFIDQLSEIHVKIVRKLPGSSISDSELKHAPATQLAIDGIKEEAQAKKDALQVEKAEAQVGHHNQATPPSEERNDINTGIDIDEGEGEGEGVAETLGTGEAINIVDQIHQGTWMKYLVKGEWVRCKVAFYAPHQQKYVFIEGSGRKLFDRNRAELIVDIQDHYAQVLDSSDNMFENALESVVSHIRTMRSSPLPGQSSPPAHQQIQ